MVAFTRYPDWAQRLPLYLKARAAMPFAWVTNDCCTFACDAVIAFTGQDPMAAVRGKYKNERQALRLIRKAGDLQTLVTEHMGDPLLRVRATRRGDLVLIPTGSEYGPSLAVCVGGEAAAAGPAGVVMLPMASAIAGWRV